MKRLHGEKVSLSLLSLCYPRSPNLEAATSCFLVFYAYIYIHMHVYVYMYVLSLFFTHSIHTSLSHAFHDFLTWTIYVGDPSITVFQRSVFSQDMQDPIVWMNCGLLNQSLMSGHGAACYYKSSCKEFLHM